MNENRVNILNKEKDGREVAAAKALYVELNGTLVHAMKRGLSIQESFSHFDMNNTGFVDTDMLVDGLARLGVGSTFQVAEKLLELIGGIGNHFLGVKDFQRYLSSSNDYGSLDGSDSIGGASRTLSIGGNTTLTSPISKNGKKSKKNDNNLDSLYPPNKPGMLESLGDSYSYVNGSPTKLVDDPYDFSSLQDTQSEYTKLQSGYQLIE